MFFFTLLVSFNALVFRFKIEEESQEQVVLPRCQVVSDD
jgi:hypothetical protein